MWSIWPLLLATVASAQLQCPTGLPGGSKYILCLAGSSTPRAQPDPYPVRLGQPGIEFLQNYAGVFGAPAVRLFRSVDTGSICNTEARCLYTCAISTLTIVCSEFIVGCSHTCLLQAPSIGLLFHILSPQL